MSFYRVPSWTYWSQSTALPFVPGRAGGDRRLYLAFLSLLSLRLTFWVCVVIPQKGTISISLRAKLCSTAKSGPHRWRFPSERMSRVSISDGSHYSGCSTWACWEGVGGLLRYYISDPPTGTQGTWGKSLTPPPHTEQHRPWPPPRLPAHLESCPLPRSPGHIGLCFVTSWHA